MNTPNPLVPQGSLLEEKARTKTSLPVAFFIFLALHAVVLGGILMVGCKREEENPKAKAALPPLTNDLPPLETNALYTPPPAATNVQPSQTPLSPPPGTNPIAHVGTDAGGIQPPPAIGGNPPSLSGGAGTIQPPAQGGGESTTPVAAGGTEYKVAKGDTFATIAKKHGTTVQKIAKANPGVNSSRLKVGQTLVIPGSTASGSGTAGNTAGSAGAAKGSETAGAGGAAGSETYTVKPGDNLTKIAKTLGTSPKAIRSANNMKTDRIVVGQKLKVPAGGKTASPATGDSATAPAAVPAVAPSPAANLAPLPPAGGPVPPRS